MALHASRAVTFGILNLSANPSIPQWFTRLLKYGGDATGLAQVDARVYNIAHGELPLSVRECQGYLVTGSRESVYDESVPWIPSLLDFMRQVIEAPSEPAAPDVRLVGICFGHQSLGAVAAGTRTAVRKAAAGWGVGPREISFDPKFDAAWMRPRMDPLCLLATHQDQVDAAALEGIPHVQVLASTEFCPVEMLLVRNPTDLRPRGLSLQPHIELPGSYLVSMFQSRRELIGAERCECSIAATLASCAEKGENEPREHDLVAVQWLVGFLLDRQDSAL
eukprot:c26157_g1_i1.p1 GENE.c26157_g1_i1~~c26157_g1_i1.p1  ORF type:complete len:278 (+),score=18.13 c26157_g1_i1:132-965(+)